MLLEENSGGMKSVGSILVSVSKLLSSYLSSDLHGSSTKFYPLAQCVERGSGEGLVSEMPCLNGIRMEEGGLTMRVVNLSDFVSHPPFSLISGSSYQAQSVDQSICAPPRVGDGVVGNIQISISQGYLV